MNHDTPAVPDGVVQHAQLEFETLGHITAALGGAVGAEFTEDDLARKLANVRFVAGSFQRYVERLFALEEHDGYMPALAESHPHLQHKIGALRKEHDTIRERVRIVVIRLESLAGSDTVEFGRACDEIAILIAKVDAHTQTETRLLQDAYDLDLGGEG